MQKKIDINDSTTLLIDPIPASDAFSFGLWLNIGSRDEKDFEHGFTHFTEHMLFKGTKRRSHYDIALEIDSVGGEINGATGKENTYYYVNIAADHFKKTISVLADMYFNSHFRKKEFEKERMVILDEIDMFRDDNDDYVFELFSRKHWKNMSFGLPVIGEKEGIKAATLADLKKYYRSNFFPGPVILSAAGKFKELEMCKEIEKHFKKPGLSSMDTGTVVGTGTVNRREKPISSPGTRILNRNTEQVHFICGREGYSYKNEERFGLALLNMIIGGSISSRLFQKIREKKGFCYSISSSSVCYTDIGEFTVSFSTSVKNLPYVLDLLDKELTLIKKGDIRQDELDRAKSRYKGYYILSKENIEWKMVKMAVQCMVYGRLIPYDETLRKVERVSLEDLNDIAGNIFNSKSFSFASIGPEGHGKYIENNRFSF
jgi:predicted Zn-dependent peptidase